MKITPSVLIGEMSGAAGPVVFSKWKGVAYVRQKVTPANPNTVAQQTQRGYFSQVVSWWHNITTTLQDYCEELIEGEPLSGFNAFQSRNVKDLVQTVDPRICPLATDIAAIETFVATTGAPGEISLTWTAGDAVPTSNIAYYVCKFPADVLTGELITPTSTGALVSALAETLSGLENGVAYQVFALVESATAEFSVAVADDATSGA